MSTSIKYDWDLTDYETVGWNGILQSFQVGVDNQLNTYIRGTLGATVAADEVLYLATDGTYKKAQAAAGILPAAGVAIEAGNNGAVIRIRRLGPYSPSSAMSGISLGGNIGEKFYIDATAGGWTFTKPAEFSQAIGRVLDASNVFVWVEDIQPIHYGTTNPGSAATDIQDGTLFMQYIA
ncbi:MAG: hypothetical protein KAS39_00810 [Actinomycetia bacterium]|nr:hypothetical protein [Actinomycetes bacterium]